MKRSRALPGQTRHTRSALTLVSHVAVHAREMRVRMASTIAGVQGDGGDVTVSAARQT